MPDILFVIDTNKEAIAVQEANKLKIPVVAVLDSNSDPDGIAYPIPGNDDAMRAIHLYCELVSGAVLDGLQAELAASGVDIGARRRRECRCRTEMPVARRGAAAEDAQPDGLTRRGRRWPRLPPRWSRSCARRPAPA